MSSSMMRLTFPDGNELFILSDGVNPIGNRLHETEEAARKLTSPERVVNNHPSVLSEEVVEVEVWSEGAQDWRDTTKFYCRASYFCKVITYGPSYGDPGMCPEW